MLHQAGLGMSLYTRVGARKYLNADERDRFIGTTGTESPAIRAFCLTLAFTGCRISEALALRASSVQHGSKVVSIRTLKRRGALSVREIPVPVDLLVALDLHINLHPSLHSGADQPLWSWSRTTAWSHVKRVMERSEVIGPQASPKGLRHGFGVNAVQSNVPLNLIQRWLGHAALSTTAIYTDALGPEEYEIAERMW